MYSNSRSSQRSRRKNAFKKKVGLQVAGQNLTVLPLSQINRMRNMIKDDVDPAKEKFKHEK
jgi:hypothetical protein